MLRYLLLKSIVYRPFSVKLRLKIAPIEDDWKIAVLFGAIILKSTTSLFEVASSKRKAPLIIHGTLVIFSKNSAWSLYWTGTKYIYWLSKSDIVLVHSSLICSNKTLKTSWFSSLLFWGCSSFVSIFLFDSFSLLFTEFWQIDFIIK